jgi:hypothetical protein
MLADFKLEKVCQYGKENILILWHKRAHTNTLIERQCAIIK